MEQLKRYMQVHFEQFFVFGILLTTVTINYFLPQKLSFLNFYFLPIILGGYYLGRRLAVMGATFCLILVFCYVLVYPESFESDLNPAMLYTHVGIWGGFLIIAGAVIGSLRERLVARTLESEALNVSLLENQDALTQANAALKDHSENLEARVQERTIELEHSRNAIESMKQKVENALFATMDPVVVNLMIEGQLRNEKRNLSLLFSDLVNFTTYSEKHPPEIVISELNRYLRDVEPIIHAYHGHLDKYMGDGIMCEFGAPLSFDTYRTMAVLAGIKMQEQLHKLAYPWEMRVGIASGAAFTGLIGFKRQTYTAIGDVVNLASRLETCCTPGHVLIDRFTYEGVSDFVDVRKMHQLGAIHNDANLPLEQQLEELHQQLEEQPDNADLHFHAGKLHLTLHEAADAMSHLERALALDASSTQYKVAYAEANLQMKENEKISVKGRKMRVEAYEVIGLRDPLLNRKKLPASFYEEYKGAVEHIKMPNDFILPVEALDNSIGHSRVVAVLSYALAGLMGMSEWDRVNVMNAGFLADIGKEIIPPHILNRIDSLNNGELELIKQHPVESGKILRKLGYENDDMLAIVTHAHEQFNGKGYPQELRGKDIPLGSRIVRVADAYDSLTSRRPYRDAWARHAALQEMRRETELGMFDPEIVAFLDKLVSDGVG